MSIFARPVSIKRLERCHVVAEKAFLRREGLEDARSQAAAMVRKRKIIEGPAALRLWQRLWMLHGNLECLFEAYDNARTAYDHVTSPNLGLANDHYFFRAACINKAIVAMCDLRTDRQQLVPVMESLISRAQGMDDVNKNLRSLLLCQAAMRLYKSTPPNTLSTLEEVFRFSRREPRCTLEFEAACLLLADFYTRRGLGNDAVTCEGMVRNAVEWSGHGRQALKWLDSGRETKRYADIIDPREFLMV